MDGRGGIEVRFDRDVPLFLDRADDLRQRVFRRVDGDEPPVCPEVIEDRADRKEGGHGDKGTSFNPFF